MAIETFEDNFIELGKNAEWKDKVRGYALGSWVQGGANGVDNVPIKDLADRTEFLKKEVDTIIGLSPGGFLTAHDFGTDNPTQQMLTDYALSQIGGDDPLRIWHFTRVKNLFDDNIWILTNTPNTVPPIFEWTNNGPEIIVTGNTSVFENEPILFASDNDRRKVIIRAGTKIELGDKTFFPHEDVELIVPNILDTGNIANGRDYYLHLVPGGDYLDIVASLLKPAPAGLNPADVKTLGGLHTLCANAGSGMTYVEGGETKQHPLNGYVASDILPYSVWCLNHIPYSEPEGMVFIPSLDFWCDIYLQSGSGKNTKSAYQGAATRSRQYVDHVEDMFCVKKALLSDEEFAAAMLGSNEQTNVAGSSDSTLTANGTGGKSDTVGRRMISIYGVEEGCGLLYQWLASTTTGQTGSGWQTQNGGKGSMYPYIYALLAGGGWSVGADSGSRCRYAIYYRSSAITNIGGRGRSRTRR